MMTVRSLIRAGAAFALSAPMFAACTTFDNVEPPSSGGGDYLPDPKTPLTTNEIKAYLEELGGTAILGEQNQEATAGAVFDACTLFSPAELSARQCAMLLVSAIGQASHFNPDSSNATTTSTVPSVGLLQDRWDSAMAEMYVYGYALKLNNTKCDLSSYMFFESVAKPLASGDAASWASLYKPNQANIDKLLQDIHCNVAIGAWHIFLHALGGPGERACADAKSICSVTAAQQGTLAGGLLGHAGSGAGCTTDTVKLVDTVQASIDRLRRKFGADALALRTTPINLDKNRARYCSGEANAETGLCTDVPSDSQYTCAEQSLWGKCDDDFLVGLCNLSCGRCGTICTDISPALPPNTPESAQEGYYCPALAAKGSCGTLADKYCRSSCKRCGASATSP